MEIKANIKEKPISVTMSKALEMTKEWASKNIELAYQNENPNFSNILMLAIIDCFAQAQYNYPPPNKSKDAFREFVLCHSHKHGKALSEVCPVTLHYDYFDPNNDKELSLVPGRLYLYNDADLVALANTLINQLPEHKRKDAIKRHQYIELLYKLRSKLVHELNPLGTPVEFVSNYPAIVQGENYYTKKSQWTLRFPKDFIYDITKEVILDRIADCSKSGTLPFPLTNEQRRCELSWYDTPIEGRQKRDS